VGAAAEADPTVLYVSGWCRSGSTVLGNVLAAVTGAEVLVDTSKHASDAAWPWRLDGIRPAQPHLVRHPRAVVGRVLALAGRPDAANPVAAGGTVTLGANHTVTGNPVRFERGPTRLQGGQGWRAGLPARRRALATAVALPLPHRSRYLGHPGGD
jgi:hypothetical protein